MSQLTFISLFAGIGGLDLGLERAGLRCVAQVEIDEYAQKVLAKHWPDVARYGDIRSVGAHNLPAADCLAGGFPCQDISQAGNKAGITGPQSGLWREYARLIRELRPRYVLVENVRALLVRGLDRVLCDLAESGYDAEWGVLSACALGAPQTRERVFLVAYPHVSGRAPRLSAVQKSGEWWHGFGGGGDALFAAVRTEECPCCGETACRLHGGHWWECDCYDPESHDLDAPALWWRPEPRVGRVATGVPYRVDRLRVLANAVTPPQAEFMGRLLAAAEAYYAEGEDAA